MSTINVDFLQTGLTKDNVEVLYKLTLNPELNYSENDFNYTHFYLKQNDGTLTPNRADILNAVKDFCVFN